MFRHRIIASLFIAAIAVSACSAYGGSTTTSAPAASSSAGGGLASAAPGGATVAAANASGFGTILAGPNGMTLYTYGGDSAGTSTCTGGCAAEWPPLTVGAGQQPSAGTGVTGALTTLKRADGTTQVAYEGLPLYYWKGDTKPGDVTGDGVNGFSVAKASAATAPAPSTSGSGGRYGY